MCDTTKADFSQPLPRFQNSSANRALPRLAPSSDPAHDPATERGTLPLPGPYREIVSLGRACQPAYQVRHRLGVTRAHVFDWVVTTDSGLRHHIDTRLAGFFSPDHLIADDEGLVRDRTTGTTFLHEFPPDTDPGISMTKAAPRIAALVDRWLALLASRQFVLFIRQHAWDPDALTSAEALVTSLCHAAPRLRFRLLYLTSPDRFQQAPDRPELLHRVLAQPDPPDWRGDGAAWGRLLDEAITLPRPPRRVR